MGVTDGTATIASGASRVQVTEDGAVFETPDGKTSIKGNAVETGKVTAGKGDIGGVWMADRNVSNVDKITAEKGDIGDVYLKDGTITAEKGDIGNVYLKDGTISAAGGQFTVDETGKVTASKGDVGGVWMADGKLSADFIQNKNGSFMADGDGNVKMNDATATGDLKVNGDASVDGTLDAGFIKNTDGSFMADGDGNVKMNDATATGNLDVAGTLTAGGGNFAVHSDGLIETRNGINAANGNFLVYDTGLIQTASGINAANGNFLVYDTGDTEVKGNVEAETFSTAGGAFKVGNDGSVTAEGQLSVGDNNAFHVNENGSFTAGYSNFAVHQNGDVETQGSITSKGGLSAADGKFEVDEDGNLTIDGAFKADGPSTIGGVTLNEGRIAAAGGKFYVDDNGGVRAEGQSAVGGVHLNEGRIPAADGAFTVDKNGNVNIGGKVTADRGVIGDVTLNDGKVTAQDGDFSGSVTAETGTIGGVTMTGGIIAADDNFVVNGETGAFRAAGNKFHVYGSGDVTADGTLTAGAVKTDSGADLDEVAANLGTLDDATVKWDDADKNSVNGVTLDNGGITGGGTTPDPDPGTDPTPGGSDLGNGWTLLSNGTTAATAVCNGGQLALTACGKFESGTQTLGFVYREVTGNFVATAQVDSFSALKDTNQALAGLLVTPDAGTISTGDFIHAMAARSLTGFYYSNRTEAAGKGNKGALGAPAATTEGAKPIVRLERAGDKFTASYSLDGGATFGAEKSVSISGLPDKLLIGLAANSGDSKKASEAVFSNVKINGQAVAFE